MLLLALTALGLLAAGIGLWALRRHRSQGCQGSQGGNFGNGGVAASTTNSSVRNRSPEVATTRIQQVLPDPSFGGWPITGDFLLDAAAARRRGQ